MVNANRNGQKPEQLRVFGLTLGGILVLVFGLALPWLFHRAYPLWPWVTAGVLMSAALIWPACLQPVFRAWMTVGNWLGWINTRIILGIMFYTVLLLAGWLMKLAGKDPMARRFDKRASSYRVPSQVRPADHLERPF